MATVVETLRRFTNLLNDQFTDREKTQLAKMVVMHVLNYDSSALILNDNTEISKEDADTIQNIRRDLNEGKPIQYILGETEFYGLSIKTDKRALIPRPETEELVKWILDVSEDRSPKIIDVGTGTGCIALALKANLPNSQVIGLDLTENAINLASENAERLGLDVKFEIANALNLQDYSRYKTDMIVSNPPYIPISEEEKMDANVVRYEPKTALFVPNENPLLFYRAISTYASKYLTPKGSLFFEVNENMAEEVVALIRSFGFTKVELRKDLQGKPRMIHAQF